jgi:hypothetical protein
MLLYQLHKTYDDGYGTKGAKGGVHVHEISQLVILVRGSFVVSQFNVFVCIHSSH